MNDSKPRSYHHPEPASHDITSIRVHGFTNKHGIRYAVVEMGAGGSLWIADAAIGRQLLAAAIEALRILDPRTADHPFTRPGQVAADRPAPDQCMECGEPEAAHPTPVSVLVDAAIEHDPDGVASVIIAALSHDMPSCDTCGAQDMPLADGQCQEHTHCAQRAKAGA